MIPNCPRCRSLMLSYATSVCCRSHPIPRLVSNFRVKLTFDYLDRRIHQIRHLSEDLARSEGLPTFGRCFLPTPRAKRNLIYRAFPQILVMFSKDIRSSRNQYILIWSPEGCFIPRTFCISYVWHWKAIHRSQTRRSF